MVLQLLAGAAALIVLLFGLGRVPIQYNLRNLSVRWKTTAMTALAFTLVISLMVVMLAFVNGMRQLTLSSGQPGNVLVLSEGSTDEVFSQLNIGDVTEIENLAAIERDPSTGKVLASRETYMVVNQSIANPKPGRPPRRFLQLRGIDDPSLATKVHNLRLLPGGQWFSEAGSEPLPGSGVPAIQAVLGEGVARELANDRTPEQRATASNPERLDVGETFKLGNRTWIVVGFLESSGSTFGSEIWAKRSLVGQLFGKANVTTLVLRTKSDKAARQLKEYLDTDFKKASVAAQVEKDFYANLSQTNLQFLVAIVFVTVIMAIGGMFGVMNTMFAAISQRIKDVGVLRLLGYSRWQILVSFVLESLVIALLGGLLGCALGMIADGWTATSVVSGHSGGGKTVILQLTVSRQIIAAGILISLIMGFLGGLIPSLTAMRLRPLEALR